MSEVYLDGKCTLCHRANHAPISCEDNAIAEQKAVHRILDKVRHGGNNMSNWKRMDPAKVQTVRKEYKVDHLENTLIHLQTSISNLIYEGGEEARIRFFTKPVYRNGILDPYHQEIWYEVTWVNVQVDL